MRDEAVRKNTKCRIFAASDLHIGEFTKDAREFTKDAKNLEFHPCISTLDSRVLICYNGGKN